MHNEKDQEIEYISKSQMKREMLALQELGEKLVALTADQLEQLELPDNLLTAILQAQTINKHGAKRRQIQYIGKLMRDVDAEDIRHQYDNATRHSAESISQFHKMEKWREQLIERGDEALEEFLTAYPDADRQQLRSLIRGAVEERKDNKPPKLYRKIFQVIKQYIET